MWARKGGAQRRADQRSSYSKSFAHGLQINGLMSFKAVPRFAMCVIEKVGSTWLHTILPQQSSLGEAAAQRLWADASATRAVFVRDPLARFASAFVNKCYGAGKDGNFSNPFCLPRRGRGRGPISFADAVRWQLSSDPTKIDAHWRLQAYHCELATRLREYNVIGLYRKSTFEQDAACLLRPLRPLAPAAAALAAGSVGGKPIRQQPEKEAEEDALLQRLFTREAADALMAHMRLDYQLFRLPRPSWLDGITGEWHHQSFVGDLARYAKSWGASSVPVPGQAPTVRL